MLLVVFSAFFESVGIDGLQFHAGAAIALGVGGAQWLRLRSRLTIDSRWIWFSLIGFVFPFALYDIIAYAFDFSLERFFLPVCVTIGALTATLFQFAILRRFASSRPWLWVNPSAWLTSLVMVVAVEFTPRISIHSMVVFVVNLALILGGGVVLGLISGPVMTQIVNDNQRRGGKEVYEPEMK